MYAAHFAAGLAIKSRAPAAPTWALMVGVFLPDFVWVALGLAGVEPSQGPAFFDDWSHSLAMVIVWATLFALCFWRRGPPVVWPVWLAVHLGWNLWDYGQTPLWSRTPYWWIQLAVLAGLAFAYVQGARRFRVPVNIIAASCLILLCLHLL
jgi:hypothetical protein